MTKQDLRCHRKIALKIAFLTLSKRLADAFTEAKLTTSLGKISQFTRHLAATKPKTLQLSAPNRAIWCDCDLKGSALRFCCDLKRGSNHKARDLKVRFEPLFTAIGVFVRFGPRDLKSLAICDLRFGALSASVIAHTLPSKMLCAPAHALGDFPHKDYVVTTPRAFS